MSYQTKEDYWKSRYPSEAWEDAVANMLEAVRPEGVSANQADIVRSSMKDKTVNEINSIAVTRQR